jgi:hypothetical protein
MPSKVAILIIYREREVTIFDPVFERVRTSKDEWRGCIAVFHSISHFRRGSRRCHIRRGRVENEFVAVAVAEMWLNTGF